MAPKNYRNDTQGGSLGRYGMATSRLSGSCLKLATEKQKQQRGIGNSSQSKAHSAALSNFLRKAISDCVRIITTNPGVRTTKGIVAFKRKGKSVRKRIAKRGDVLEVYEGKATSEYVERFPKEWEAYQVAQRKDEN